MSQSLLQHYEGNLLEVKVSLVYILEDNLDGNIGFEVFVLRGEDGRQVVAFLMMRVGALPSDSILVKWTQKVLLAEDAIVESRLILLVREKEHELVVLSPMHFDRIKCLCGKSETESVRTAETWFRTYPS